MSVIKTFCFNPFDENTYVIHDQGECLIVDPGNYTREETNELITFIEEHGFSVRKIVNTHGHVDHVTGIAVLKDYFKVPFAIGKNELEVIRRVKLYAPLYGFTGYSEPEVDEVLVEDDEIEVGTLRWRVLDVPGHSPGHIALYEKEAGLCIAGDVLFNRSIGRTDLPGGDFDTLISSIHNKLFTLPDNVKVYPGHGPETTIGEERVHNPFCGENKLR